MKKFISIFLLFIITIQCLPVKELGKYIFDSNFAEEDICNNNLEKKEIIDFLKEFFNAEYSIDAVVSKIAAYYNENIDLFKNPFADLSIEPPNA